MIDLIAFDADDTLWHNEIHYENVQQQFYNLLAAYDIKADVARELYQTETANLACYGYGIKSFTLSMIETAIRLTGGRVSARDIEAILGYAREMIEMDIELIENAGEVVADLAQTHDLMIITKGDLLDQEAKLARSGLMKHFKYVEIVSHKNEDAYARVLSKYQLQPERFLMVGNSLRSDVLPVAALGGHAVYIPYHLTWAHELEVGEREAGLNYIQLDHIGMLPELIRNNFHI